MCSGARASCWRTWPTFRCPCKPFSMPGAAPAFRSARYAAAMSPATTRAEIRACICAGSRSRSRAVADFKSKQKFDLVVCQDVMQYMSNDEAEQSFVAITRVCRGALYFDVPTSDDIKDGFLDMRKTDRHIHVRSAAWYRKRLQKDFVSAGGGLFVTNRSRAIVLALERGR